jgi:hypothetical protein
MALGGAYISGINGVEAIHWNPAGLASMGGRTAEALFSRMNYFADIGVSYFAVAGAFPSVGTFALSIRGVGFGDIPVTTEELPDGTGDTFNPQYITAGITYSRQLTDRILVGFTTKLVTEKIVRTSASALAFDAGVQYIAGASGMKIGIAIKNLGPSMKFDGEDLARTVTIGEADPLAPQRPLRFSAAEFELPSVVEIGLSYDFKLPSDNLVTVSGAFRNNNYGTDQYQAAAEYSYNNMFFLRGAYSFSNKRDGSDIASSNEDYIYGPSAGAGVNYDLGGFNVSVDYAYRSTKFFKGNSTIAVKLGF